VWCATQAVTTSAGKPRAKVTATAERLLQFGDRLLRFGYRLQLHDSRAEENNVSEATESARALAHRTPVTRALTDKLGAFSITILLGVAGLGGMVQQCAPPPPALVQVHGVQDSVVDAVNFHRANAGVRRVNVDARLTNAAQSHANDMANRRVMTHLGADGSNGGQRISRQGYGAWTWAENVAAGQTTPDDVMRAWMNSAGHRANILNGKMVNIGIAAARGSNGVTYWTLVFAA
jgi:uncharacterized protein YkwD